MIDRTRPLRPLTLVKSGAQRPRLLLLAQTLPFPPDGGVHIRIFNVLKLLALRYDVSLICFTRRAERDARAVEDGIAALGKWATVSVFEIPQERSRLRLVWDHLRSLFAQRAYVWYAYESASFRSRLEALLLAQPFDVVQLDSMDLARYLPMLTAYPTVCVHHNVESALMAQRAAREPWGIRRWYLGLQSRLLEDLERRWCPVVSLNIAVSDEDKNALEAIAPMADFVTVPNGVDVETFLPAKVEETGIVSTGGLNWFPNADAVSHFCAHILPIIRAKAPDTAVRWIGRAEPEQVTEFWEAGRVELLGRVHDIRPYVRAAACFVVPLRVGGGTRLKILDAWAMGKAVVSTSVGCSGLRAVDGENILIRDRPEEFAEAVLEVLRNRELRRHLGASARRTVEETYSWGIVGAGLTRAVAGLHGVSAAIELDADAQRRRAVE